MPTPQLDVKSPPRERPTYEEMLWEQLRDTKTEVREIRKELNARMDRLEVENRATRQELNARIDKLEAEIKSMRQELNDNINDLRKVVQSSTNHGQISNITTVGIAVAIICALLFK